MSDCEPTIVDQPLFSERLGWRSVDWPDNQPFASRHNRGRADSNAHPLSWCACPALRQVDTPCAQRMTQEDSLCDQCREWCVGVARMVRRPLKITVPG